MATAEFSKFAGILSAALTQHHLLGFEIAQLEFHHPLRTTVTFDYGIIEGRYEQIQAQFENPEVVCKLNESEYIDLIYAMYKSHHTKARHKEILNRILEQYYSK